MIIAAFLEPGNETRVAITPDTARHYIKFGFQVFLEKNAGLASGFSNEEYEHTGTQLFDNKKKFLNKINILLCVNEPNPKELLGLTENTLIIGPIENNSQSPLIQWALKQKISLFSMNLIPRISRAQSMDILSSQANLAGYKAVIEAVNHYHKVIPMMMTAAGMIQPTKILILGAGVAGLQAIATAKRLGAVVYAFDVRHAAKEQVESLGAQFIEVPQEQDAENKAGYATETSEEYQKAQAKLIDEYAQLSDIIISTALIPGRKAPILLYKTTVERMKRGSIIVDLATSQGGNCEVSQLNNIIKFGEVTIIGMSNMATLVPATASFLYANNLMNLANLLISKEMTIHLNPEDEIIREATLCHNGSYQPFQMVKEKQHAS